MFTMAPIPPLFGRMVRQWILWHNVRDGRLSYYRLHNLPTFLMVQYYTNYDGVNLRLNLAQFVDVHDIHDGTILQAVPAVSSI